jgi:site-specific DNA-methyltransferase (adenine-specific)
MKITNEDNMELMSRYPDNYFDLAIVDPPYGIGMDGDINIKKKDRPSTWDKKNKYQKKEWDNEIPNKEYFDELFRVSKNQIIWGGNYFTEYLQPSKCWIFWDKLFDKTFNFSHGELAWTSFNKQLLKVTKSSKAESNGGKDRIHPTQKPVALYKWILDKYAKEGDKILDTHLGSGSIAIACHDFKFDLTACELDKEYFDQAMKRIENHKSQLKLF